MHPGSDAHAQVFVDALVRIGKRDLAEQVAGAGALRHEAPGAMHRSSPIPVIDKVRF